MGRRLRRHAERAASRDPDLARSTSELVLRIMRPFVTKRRYARELFGSGTIWQRAGRYQEALIAFDRVMALRGSRVQDIRAMALGHRAFCQWGLENYRSAVASAEKAIPLLEPLAAEKPGRYGVALFQAWCALGFGHYHLGRMAEAVPAFERYLRMARTAPVQQVTTRFARRALAFALLDLDRPADALPHAEEALRLTASDSGAHQVELARAQALESECRHRAG